MRTRTDDPSALKSAFDAFVDRYELLPAEGPLAVAVSGGIDSMVLLDLVSARVPVLHVCHLNYGLRGEESDSDEAFVREAADRYGAEFHVHREDPRGGPSSIQARARRIRYDFFSRIARESGASAVAVGHNLDDQAESILLSLLRGAGPRGLRGMQARRRLDPAGETLLVRPLLPFDRLQISAIAAAHGVSWRDDSSNIGVTYRRNALRHRVLPVLGELFGPETPGRIARFGQLMGAYAEMEDGLVSSARSTLNGVVTVPLKRLSELPPVLRGRAVLDALAEACPQCGLSRELAERIVDLCTAQVGRRICLGEVTVVRDREALVFQGLADPFDGVLLPVPGSARVPGGWIEATACPQNDIQWDTVGSDTAYCDAASLPKALEVRRWRPGDRMRPLGGSGSRKVSDLLTDARVDASTRAERLVVAAGGRIVWIPGVRASDEFRVRDDTRFPIRLHLRGDPPDEPGRKAVSWVSLSAGHTTLDPTSSNTMTTLQVAALAPQVVVRGERFRLLYSPEVLQARVREMGAEISADYAGKRPILIGVLNGAFMFLADLMRVIELECEVDFMKLSSYGSKRLSSGEVKQLKAVDAGLKDRDVIVVEDIVDTGHSMEFILSLLASYEPASLRVAALLHKPEATVKEVPLDYVGFEIPNEFVIGYGLDYGQHGRNLPGLYIRVEETAPNGADSGA